MKTSRMTDFSEDSYLEGFRKGDKVKYKKDKARFNVLKNRVYVIKGFYTLSRKLNVCLEDNPNFEGVISIEDVEKVS